MAITFKLIASVNVGSGGTTAIDFTSIPNSYTDLCLFLCLRHDTTDGDIRIRYNASSSSIYSRMNLYNSNGSAGSNSASGESGFYTAGTSDNSGYTANVFSNAYIYFPNYAGSTNKPFSKDGVTENAASNIRSELSAGLFASTSAISQITIENSGSGTNKFVQYSTAYLYGISNA